MAVVADGGRRAFTRPGSSPLDGKRGRGGSRCLHRLKVAPKGRPAEAMLRRQLPATQPRAAAQGRLAEAMLRRQLPGMEAKAASKGRPAEKDVVCAAYRWLCPTRVCHPPQPGSPLKQCRRSRRDPVFGFATAQRDGSSRSAAAQSPKSLSVSPVRSGMVRRDQQRRSRRNRVCVWPVQSAATVRDFCIGRSGLLTPLEATG